MAISADSVTYSDLYGFFPCLRHGSNREAGGKQAGDISHTHVKALSNNLKTTPGHGSVAYLKTFDAGQNSAAGNPYL